MSNKEIEQRILNYDLEIGDLEDYKKEDFVSTVTGMINALYVLMKHADKNVELIDGILEVLENTVEEKEEENLKIIIELIDRLNNRIDATYNKKNKNNIAPLRIRLIRIIKEIENTKRDEVKSDILKIIRKVVYDDKNITNVEAIINNRKNIDFKIIDEIFSSVLEDYVSSFKEDDIKYFYKVIIIFVNSCFYKDLEKNSERYMTILNNGAKKEHVKLLIDRLNNKYILLDDLKKKYDISTNNNLIYIKPSIKICNYERHDFRYQKVFTIDEEDNKCNDDGLYIEKNKNGTYTLYIHISDAPSLIEKDSYLDFMAYKMGETIYLKDDEFTAYPEVVSNNLGSLLQGNMRNVITYKFLVTPDFHIDPDSFVIERGLINVNRCLSYNWVDKKLQKDELDDIGSRLRALDIITTLLKNNNLHKDIYRTTENKTTGIITNSSLAGKSKSAKIVQELMILTNSYVDKYFVERNFPYIHRVHNAPSNDIDKDIMLILGIDPYTLLNNPKCVKIVNAVKEKYLNAEYSGISGPHYGLGLDYYSHSTSPLRRYADALGQYIIYDTVFNNNVDDKTIYKWESIVKEVCPYLNERIKNNALFASEYNYLVSKRKIRKK